LSDGGWEVIRPLLPPRACVGRPRVDDGLVVNVILHVLDRSYKTCWDRFRRWSVMVVWSKILEALIATRYSNGKLRLDKVAVDITTLKLYKE